LNNSADDQIHLKKSAGSRVTCVLHLKSFFSGGYDAGFVFIGQDVAPINSRLARVYNDETLCHSAIHLKLAEAGFVSAKISLGSLLKRPFSRRQFCFELYAGTARQGITL
jgi:hypothetical protein